MLQALKPNTRRKRVAKGKSVPAPVEGWDAVSPLSAMKPTRAIVLDNWFPQPGYVEVRKGYSDHINGMGSATSIESLMAYHGVTAASDKMFAVAGGYLYDVSSTTTVTEGNDQYTKVLLHFDEIDGSTTFTDEAKGVAHTWTANGDAQIDTAQSKFGGSSALFDGTGDFLSTPDAADLEFGSGDLTIDAWVRFSATTSTHTFIRKGTIGGSNFAFTFEYAHGTTALAFQTSSDGTSVTTSNTATWTPSVDTWYHVAAVRTSGVVRLFVNGTQVGIDSANTDAVFNGAGSVTIAATSAGNNPFAGWLDEVRVSVGTARWTTTFTPPTSRYGLTAALSGLANSRWQYVNYTTSANVAYLWMCNGSDAPRHYNGSAWATPAITVVSEEDTINVNVYKKRIWGILKNSLDAYFLPSDAVAGAATKFPLGSIFQKGGYLVAMATWTLDSGEGPDDYAVFITSKGQVAVYGGYDPTDATNFLLKGIFDLPAPIGYRCFCKMGADLAVITIGGVLPLSKAIQVDKSQDAAISFTLRINNAMNTAAQSYASNFGWELTTFPKGTMAVLNVPLSENSMSHQYVMNTITGAWCRFTGWDANTFCLFQDNLYFGGNVGKVEKAWTGSIDGSTTIEADGQTAYNYFGDTGINKRFTALQPLITTDQTVVPSLGISTDYKDNASISTPSATSTASALYDSAIYDTDIYSVEGRSSSDWTTVGNIGQCASIHFRASASATGTIITQMNGFNITYATGEFY